MDFLVKEWAAMNDDLARAAERLLLGDARQMDEGKCPDCKNAMTKEPDKPWWCETCKKYWWEIIRL